MSEYFRIVNYTRRQFIQVSAFQNCKLHGIGQSLAGRMFGRLLTTESEKHEMVRRRFGNPETDELHLGAWIGEQVAITGDYARAEDYPSLPNLIYPENLLDDTAQEFEDITDKALTWLAKDHIIHDEFAELVKAWGETDHFRRRLEAILKRTNDENIRTILALAAQPAPLDLNQVTIPVTDVERSIAFYETLGLRLIVKSVPKYARFECPGGASTFSLHSSELPLNTGGTWIYFELEDLDGSVKQLVEKGIVFETLPEDQSWLWRESRLKDPDGNQVILYRAGKNRKDPPWRLP